MKSYYDSPIGWLELSASDNALRAIHFLETKPNRYSENTNRITQRAMGQLSEYFNGNRTRFSIPLNAEGTDFQVSVWNELKNIPYGQTITYGELAKKLGDPNKVRAVGKANGQNPIPIIVPCHRVIGADDSLVGYAGGVARKQYLLKHEGALLL